MMPLGAKTHIDLFSGIGGFAFAARHCGIRTVAFCESDPRCQAFLAAAWPGIPCWSDARTFDGERWRGAWLLTAGVPCQPASRAGKQRGAADDRWLWPEAIRVLAEVRPTWALFENPPGIGDVGLAGILAAVEGLDCEVRVFGIPACAVGAPHRRERYWIVAHHIGAGRQKRGMRPGIPEATGCGDEGQAVDMGGEGRVEDSAWDADGGIRSQPRSNGERIGWWSSYIWLPCADGKVRRAPDDSFGLVDGLHRSILGALGNSIVPQVAARIIGAMISAESHRDGP